MQIGAAHAGSLSPLRVTARPPGYLSPFLGPMGENSELLHELVGLVLDDHLHWRRNYFPQDQRLFTSRDVRAQSEQHDDLRDRLGELVARLRRSFPFHNPRYIAHQQSELSIPTLAGYVAGMLYNSNNVTSESGAVTLEMENEATSALLQMLGFAPPPVPPSQPSSKPELDAYSKALLDDYGYCHLTSGGTTANIEALWVARNVRYRALTVRSFCIDKNIPVEVRHPSQGDLVLLGDLSERETLGLSPREASGLISRAVAIMDGDQLTAWKQHSSEPSWPAILSEHPPAVFVAGSRHYSISKSLDVLGMGSEHLIQVVTDSRHRLRPDDLAVKIRQAIGDGKIPLAVVAIIGTTEEGAIDPLDQILAVRTELERERGQSFWVHADGAWGGYMASLIRPDPKSRFEIWAETIAQPPDGATDAERACRFRRDEQPDPVIRWVHALAKLPPAADGSEDLHVAFEQTAIDHLRANRWDDLRQTVEAFLDSRQTTAWIDSGATPSPDAYAQRAKTFVADQSSPPALVHSPERDAPYRFTYTLSLDDGVLAALGSLGDADSITVDPHKMGYQPYPCGAIAFRDDRVRDYVRQKAPYITKLGDRPVRQPAVYLEEIRSDRDEEQHGNDAKDDQTHEQKDPAERTWVKKVDAPALYTFEGSRPSAPATALWLSTQCLPLHQGGHGGLVRDTLRAANELFQWISKFQEYRSHLGGDAADFDLVPLSLDGGLPAPPDTNLVIFGVRRANEQLSLKRFNQLNAKVLERFSIAAERGDLRHSYGQPFFLSNTEFTPASYPSDAISPIAEAAGIADFDAAYVETNLHAEMRVLRSSVLNPYLEYRNRRTGDDNLLLEFMRELAAAASDAWADLDANNTESTSRG